MRFSSQWSRHLNGRGRSRKGAAGRPVARALGFARSLAIYYGLPWRARALRRRYRRVPRPGRPGVRRRRPCRQSHPLLRGPRRPGDRDRAPAGVRRLAAPAVRARASRSPWSSARSARRRARRRFTAAARTPTVATLSPALDRAVRRSRRLRAGRLAGLGARCRSTTLDALIAPPRPCRASARSTSRASRPRCCAGSRSRSRRCRSSTCRRPIDVARCAAGLLAELGRYRFNLTIGERRRLHVARVATGRRRWTPGSRAPAGRRALGRRLGPAGALRRCSRRQSSVPRREPRAQAALLLPAAFIWLSLLWNLPVAPPEFGAVAQARAGEVVLLFALLALVPPLRPRPARAGSRLPSAWRPRSSWC